LHFQKSKNANPGLTIFAYVPTIMGGLFQSLTTTIGVHYVLAALGYPLSAAKVENYFMRL